MVQITNVHAQTLLMTCRAGIRCTQEAILALSSFLKSLDRTVELQWLFSPSLCFNRALTQSSSNSLPHLLLLYSLLKIEARWHT